MIAQDRKSTRLNSSHTVIYTLSLHDALPISASCLVARHQRSALHRRNLDFFGKAVPVAFGFHDRPRSEEHTSELQSHRDLHSFPTRRSSDLGVMPRSPPPAQRPPSAQPRFLWESGPSRLRIP